MHEVNKKRKFREKHAESEWEEGGDGMPHASFSLIICALWRL